MTVETGSTEEPAQGVAPAPDTPPAAPAIANAAPANPAPAPAPSPEEPAADAPAIQYEETGDPGLDLALAFVGGLGIGVDHPAMKAAMQGDYTLMEAHLASLGDKAAGWEKHVALAKAADERAKAARDERDAAVTSAAVQAAGGEDAWKAIQEWSVANADPDEKAAINKMFDDGPISARIAVMAMRVAYSEAQGTIVNPANPLRNMAGGNPSANGALSPREYASEVQALRNRLGREFETSQEYAALRARLRR